jgi:hypothetical protein
MQYTLMYKVSLFHRKWSHLLFIGILALGVALSTVALAASTAPLIQSSDMTYLGAFALPSWAGKASGAYGTSWFEYGGHALTFYHDPQTGKRTLFMEGHAHNPGQVAQVEIPSAHVKSTNWGSLPMAPLLQPFASIPSAPDPSSCMGNPSFIYGMLAYGGRLIVGAACSYGGSQTTSHGAHSLNLQNSAFQGFYGFSGAAAPPRALGGPMTTIPSEWQTLFGGPALTGLFGVSVTGSTSAGPAATVFNPNHVGVVNPIPGKTVLFYPLTNPACGPEHCEAVQTNVYNLTTVYGGMAFPRGSRSVLFVTAHGTGCYWYGGWDQNSLGPCPSPDPYLQDVKGPHAPPYQYQVLAYDANDLLAVKNGTKQVWEPEPYAVIKLDGMPYSDNDKIKGAAFDPETGRLYITQDYGTNPRVEVYQITVPGTGNSDAVAPSPPTNLRVD